MNKQNSEIEKYLFANTKSFKDYIQLIRNNFKNLILVASGVLLLSVAYAFLSKDIYTSTVAVRITNPYKDVLESSRRNPDNTAHDRYIISEMGVVMNYSTREKVASALIDSFKISDKKDQLPLIRKLKDKRNTETKTVSEIANLLEGIISVAQNQGTDVIIISAESRSPYEAALIVNCTANEYQLINTAVSRDKLTSIRKFLEDQSRDKLAELRGVEDSLRKFQEEGGIISFEVQSSGLIGQLSALDAQRETIKMELSTSNEVLKQYKFFLRKQDPQLVEYLEGQTSQAYINALQQQIAELQVERDIAASIKSPTLDVSAKVQDYDKRIAELKQNLSSAIGTIKANAFSGNPDQVRDLAQRLVEEEIRNSALTVQLEQVESTIRKYEGNLRRLPKTSTALTQYQRERESLQQMYLLLNDRYQEAVINELSESGNARILHTGVVPIKPSKPNRIFIILVGFLLGPIIGFALILIKDYFDNSVKTPEDIEKEEINFLSWVPEVNNDNKSADYVSELITLFDQDSPISESFRAIRARIQHLGEADGEFPKLILVTSPAEHEGKTFTSMNLAGSFAQSNKRTLLIDCDFRRPRIHEILGVDKKPGLVDYLAKKVKLEEIIRSLKSNNLGYITAGTIPPNPAEILESRAMKNFLIEIREFFDVVILDSAPIVAVIDAEILAKQAEGTILVVASEKTEKRLMTDAVDIIKSKNVNFLGTVLNNFRYKSGYGYYYKYYYHYNKDSRPKRKKILG